MQTDCCYLLSVSPQRMQMNVPSSQGCTSSEPQQGHWPFSSISIFFSFYLRCKGNEKNRERSEEDLFLDNKWCYRNILVNGDVCWYPFSHLASFVCGFPPIRVFTTFLRRKGKANRECAKYRHPFSKSIPWHSDRQPSAVFHAENWVFLTECPAIPCLHSLSCSPSSWRCKKLIPDGIQPIKKTAHEGQAKSKKVSPSGSSQ